MPQKKNPHAVALGRRGGLARANTLSRQQRQAIAKKAAKAATRARKQLPAERRTELARQAAQARWGQRRPK